MYEIDLFGDEFKIIQKHIEEILKWKQPYEEAHEIIPRIRKIVEAKIKAWKNSWDVSQVQANEAINYAK